MAAALAYVPFRFVAVSTRLVGRVMVWLADGYRRVNRNDLAPRLIDAIEALHEKRKHG